MYAYYRTSCHGTVNQKILRGSFSSNDSSDLVLVKGNSLEWMTIGPVTESDPNLLKRQLQQSTFGTIIDTQLLRCLFTETADTTTTATTLEEEFYEDIPYSKKIRNHAMIQGRDVLVALSEYGKLVFMTIHSDLDLGVKRFETMTEVYLDSPGLEYTKVGKKLAVDP
ncbi:hypothetical protein HPULCUR_010421 [Helicostylum pulchrum]|uniref:RSE1/DDB1/CPSF1 first beta-propeller domain-containing protein n=1 Tax=Helicostylum pulchrum TaxID=562976 RepID=A0ABP9YD71_9FUNG